MKLNVDDLVQKKLVIKKTYTDGPYKGLYVLKYHNRVFYDNLWNTDERLLECRGTVVDEDDNVIVLPFKKVFNMGENATHVDPEREIIAPRKVNGFLGCATQTEKYGLIISTSGTLDSEYAQMARKWIEKGETSEMLPGVTYLFEICDPEDQHIVPEESGAYLIGCRNHENQKLLDEDYLDMLAYNYLGYKRPEVWRGLYKDLPSTRMEGYMIRDAQTQETLAKLKSPYYLVRKAMIRMGKSRASLMFNNPDEFRKQIDEEFYDLHTHIIKTYTLDQYVEFKLDEREQILNEYFTYAQ
ncbi:putative RNA ligase I/ Tail attachment protein [Vibrio phage phiKT1024]|nr:putative RNA ligase I/ Tail attachment protein [Vibrio phage phiKT1024]